MEAPEQLVFIVRWLTVLLSLATVGIAVVVMFVYLRDWQSRRRAHVVRVALSYIAFVFVAMGHIIERATTGGPWQWYASPLALVGSVLGVSAVGKFLIKPKKADTPAEQGTTATPAEQVDANEPLRDLVTAAEKVVTVAERSVLAAEHTLARAEDAVENEKATQGKE